MAVAHKLKDLDDLLALGEDARAELVNGDLCGIETSGEHSDAQAQMTGFLQPHFGRPARRDDGPPGGWWIYVESTIAFSLRDVLRPDVAGWRRDRVPSRPTGFPVRELPDWVCEVLSPSTARRDLNEKRRVYHAAKVGHYWVIDLEKETLTALRWSLDGYVIVAVHGPGELARIEPFEAMEFPVGVVFGREE
ncbi:MAG: Uma2 family endonuclease [Deltaproteobacteria bacterium]|nr:Uma2 family endonuclease [Deltaproteobacteria bacterium]